MANTTGKKYGGRKKGTPNKKSMLFEELLSKTHSYDPLEAQVEVANLCRSIVEESRQVKGLTVKEYNDLDAIAQKKALPPKDEIQYLRIWADVNKDMMNKIYANRKAVEVSTDDDNVDLSFSINVKDTKNDTGKSTSKQ